MKYDVIIIGGGVVGCAIARELSRYQLDILLIEKEMDVGLGTSSRNSGVLHSGIHYKPGTIRAETDVKGNAMMAGLCKDLKVKYEYLGKLTVAQNADEVKTLHHLKEQGEANGVPGLEIIDSDKMQKLQPGVTGIKALHSPSTGIISPYGLTIALAENAMTNGVEFSLGTEVTGIQKGQIGFTLTVAPRKTIQTRFIINAAGLFSAKVADMAGAGGYRIYPCRGEYYILDKRLKGALSILVYPVPGHGSSGLGIHLTNTVDGNILIGPSNEYIDEFQDLATTAEVMRKLKKEGFELLPQLSQSDFIRTFSGLRPKQNPPEIGGFKDFVIESRKDVKGFINLVGIESPGLTAAPAIALKVKDLLAELTSLNEKPDFTGERSGFTGHFCELPKEQRADMIARDPDYGEIICRCEQITKKEILDAIHNPLGARILVGIKNRSRAMMGRCQGGFCMPRIVRILEREFGYSPEDYLLKSAESPLFSGWMRG
ncbi:MAG: NAD(P)/FAD-dependent oxidoreductase [Deltaproteobacteria bacterium]|nr:NAD(P)/FAD-dependent oxidoreductase [Deltaproteobacteria bacterium]